MREALSAVVGEKTVRELVKEAKATERVFQERVRTVLRGSSSNSERLDLGIVCQSGLTLAILSV